MTLALIDAAHDKDENTQEVISTALFELGKKKPLLVLSACHSYLKKHSKVCSVSGFYQVSLVNGLCRIWLVIGLNKLQFCLAIDLR